MTRLLAALAAALLLFNSAWACSCMARKDTGFIHANLKRLPANARGALFLTLDTQLKASAFLITSDAGALPASLSWPNLVRRYASYKPAASNCRPTSSTILRSRIHADHQIYSVHTLDGGW